MRRMHAFGGPTRGADVRVRQKVYQFCVDAKPMHNEAPEMEVD